MELGSKRIKLIFGALGFGAVFFAFVFIDYFMHGSVRSAFNLANISSVSFDISTDEDKDGLNNTDESYWNTDFQNPDTDGDGFLDGEEVASGHDPTKPGPDDKIVLENENITQQISDLIVAGLAEGSLKSDSPNFDKSVDQVASAIVFQSTVNYGVPKIKLTSIPDTEYNINEYAKKVYPILKEIIENGNGMIELLDLLDSVDIYENSSDKKFVDLMSTQTSKIQAQIQNLNSIKVPASWLESHATLVATLESLNKTYIFLGQINVDPMQAMFSLNTLTSIFITQLPDITDTYINNLVIKR